MPRFPPKSRDLPVLGNCQMPGNRRRNDLKERAPIFDDGPHAAPRRSRRKGHRDFFLTETVAKHEKPREIGEPGIVRIVDDPVFGACRAGGFPIFGADDVGGPPATRNRPRSCQCRDALLATHRG